MVHTNPAFYATDVAFYAIPATGSWGITAANVSQLRVYRAFGVERIMLANQLLDPSGLAWLADELDANPEFEFSCFVDSVRGAQLMAEALAHHGASRQVDVLVELGSDGARPGARTIAEAREIADLVLESPMLRLVGSAATRARWGTTSASSRCPLWTDTWGGCATSWRNWPRRATSRAWTR
ncbi:hypothetical protein [Saccharopolyspora spinosa]|uniref:hypothetical protein n=1 Tax=Saccharopolyspora spinosa TaxID=60894 RepID=UPI0002F1911A|nr:hypothetical protein [Saccharopolyspora spinosa]